MELRSIKLADCFESPTNPRGTKFEGSEFDELVASVTEKGVLMPVLARPQADKFEIVAGNRRLRAAKKAGLKEIPARVVELTDNEVREAQIVENLQRADVHPLEEGAAYRDLIERTGYDIEAVAVKVGKSESYVRNRLVLTNLVKPAQQAFRSNVITASHAALIARLDDKLQKDALEFLNVNADERWREVPSASDLRNWIQRQTYADSMANPPWKNDEEMEVALGGCEECSGMGGDLFGKKAADACTNPTCFANRMAAYIDIKLRAQPKLVKISSNYTGDEGIPGSGQYHEVHGKKDKCEHGERGIVVVGDGLGHIKTICRAPECKTHWATSRPGGYYKPTAEEREARKKSRAAEQKRKDKDDAAVLEAVGRVQWPLKDKHLDILFDTMFERFGYTYMQGIAARHGIKADKVTRNGYTHRDLDTPLRTHFEALGKNGKAQFLFEVCVQATYDTSERKAVLKKL